jgi:FkbM family methyltransferase
MVMSILVFVALFSTSANALWVTETMYEEQTQGIPVYGMAYNGTSWSFSCDNCKDFEKRLAGTIPLVPWSETDDCKTGPPEGYKWHSQFHEDIDLYNNYFCNRKGGTFVEIGALDGVRWSNTKFFEESMGWSGLLIEAAPKSVAQLRKNRNNESNLILAEGVCPQGQGNMSFLTGLNPDTNGNPEDMPKEIHNQWHTGKWGKKDKMVTVPCRPLGTMVKDFLKKSGATHIDFFSLDVEGGEFSVLSTFDFDVPVHVWVVEMDGANPSKDESVRKTLMKHGYIQSNKTFAARNNEVWVMSQII